MSATDRALFRRSESDVYMSFPYQLGIVMDDADGNLAPKVCIYAQKLTSVFVLSPLAATKRWVEVMVVYHTLQGFEKLQEKNISVTDMQKDDVSKLFMFANFRYGNAYFRNCVYVKIFQSFEKHDCNQPINGLFNRKFYRSSINQSINPWKAWSHVTAANYLALLPNPWIISIAPVCHRAVCNPFCSLFRFSRNYSKGLPPGQSEWIINYLNYFTPESDHEEAKKERLG